MYILVLGGTRFMGRHLVDIKKPKRLNLTDVMSSTGNVHPFAKTIVEDVFRINVPRELIFL